MFILVVHTVLLSLTHLDYGGVGGGGSLGY